MASKKPRAVILGDIHFTVGTLELASSALRQALGRAKELNVPLLMNGDTLDTNAVMRGECTNRLIDILSNQPVQVIVNTGNHDLLNRHSKEHVLNFLHPYAEVVSHPAYFSSLDAYVVPYYHDNEELTAFLSTLDAGSMLYMHQGLVGADMGAYTKDSSSLTPEYFANFRVISSHYHKKQDIKCGRPRKGAVGLFSYIGAPYSISFSEAGDGPKGFSIVYDDGTLELVPTNLRKHVKVERLVEDALNPIPGLNPEDLLWVVIKGPASEMDKLTRPALAKAFGISNFKLDKVPDEVTALDEPEEKLTDLQVFDRLVEQGTDGAEVKAELKRTARELMESAA